MAKKDFKIDTNLIQGISDSIGSSESAKGNLRTENIPLSRIQLDPENARKLSISVNDIKNGIATSDPLHIQKKAEYDDLKEFSTEIEEDGLIQPITVYRQNDLFILIAGERRVLASFIANLNFIPAIIRKKPSNEYKISRLQWNENIKRKDLNLWEKLSGIERLINAYKKDIEPGAKLNANLISKVANLSSTEAYRYLSILNSDETLKREIEKGTINNLKKAELISKINNQELKQNAISQCVKGASLDELNVFTKTGKKTNTTIEITKKKNTAGRQATQVILGKTKSINVAQQIYAALKDKFGANVPSEPQWNELSSVNETFREIINFLERNTNA